MTQRSKNELRRGLTAASLMLYLGQRSTQAQYMGNFVIKTLTMQAASFQFTYYNNNLRFVQRQRQRMMLNRTFFKELMVKRLLEQKDFLVSHYKTKAKKSKNAGKVTKHMKKIFDKDPQQRYLKEQINNLQYKYILDCQILYLSIRVRALQISLQVLMKVTDKEATKDDMEVIRVDISDTLKRIKTIKTKIEKEVEPSLFGIPNDEIKEIQKKAKGRKPDKETLIKAK